MTISIHTSQNWNNSEDVIIVGAGLAGLFCALKLAPGPVTVLSAAPLGEGASSAWAQGGIAAAMSQGDSIDAHVEDTLAAGAGIVDIKIARLMAREASDRIHDLLELGVPFDRDLEGHLKFSREAAHSERRIVRVNGDQAGKAIMDALLVAVRQASHIRVLEGYVCEKLLKNGSVITGIVARPEQGNALAAVVFPARAIVLASGGIGHLYNVTTNPVEASGTGLAMAADVGAVLADCEFVQFHPTALNVGADPAPLATEALRGEGAILVDDAGNCFMKNYHVDAELAPRDIVARAIFEEIKQGRGANLDSRHVIGNAFKSRFQTVYASAQRFGLNPETGVLPVAPAAHYHMGGVLTDANGRTSVNGLWAAGEVASTGAHGANRLASNSLLEAVVFAARVANDIQDLLPASRVDSWATLDNNPPMVFEAPDQDMQLRSELRDLMSENAGVVRNAKGLSTAYKRFSELEKFSRSDTTRSMIIACKLVTASALMRRESRGGHYRDDFPDTIPDLAKRSFIKLAELDRKVDEYLDT